MRIVVAGATGVLGQEATAALVTAGHTVLGITRRDSGLPVIEGRGGHGIVADVFSLAEMTTVLTGADILVNTLTNIPIGQVALKPGAWRADDRLHEEAAGTLTSAALEAGVSRLIQESTTFLYPDRGVHWIDEDVPLAPKLPFQRARMSELRHAVNFSQGGRSAVILRFGLLYGRDRQSTLMLANARSNKPALLGSKEQYISLVHNSDAGAAFVAALRAGPGAYNVVGEPILRSRWAMDVAREAGADEPARFYPEIAQLVGGGRIEPLRRSHRISSRRFRSETGWAPRIGPGTTGWSR